MCFKFYQHSLEITSISLNCCTCQNCFNSFKILQSFPTHFKIVSNSLQTLKIFDRCLKFVFITNCFKIMEAVSQLLHILVKYFKFAEVDSNYCKITSNTSKIAADSVQSSYNSLKLLHILLKLLQNSLNNSFKLLQHFFSNKNAKSNYRAFYL